MYSPNVWRLPIAQLETSERTDVKLAASTVLLPHWGGLARCAAGLVCLAVAAAQEGISPATLGLVPLVLAVAWCVLTLSAALARGGVARPDLDVLQLVVRWGGREKELAPISLGASVLQFLLGIATIPAAKLLPPSVLFRPELGPSPAALLGALVVSALLAVLTSALWFRRVDLTAPPAQQREAEENA